MVSTGKETPIRIWSPKVGSIDVTSKDELKELIRVEYPGLKRNPRFFRLSKDAELQFDLKKLCERKKSSGFIVFQIFDEYGLSFSPKIIRYHYKKHRSEH